MYELEGPHLLCQVSKVLFEEGKEGDWIEVVECDGGQLRKCLELWEVWPEILGCKLLSHPDYEFLGVPG